jgi:hypothetical protein
MQLEIHQRNSAFELAKDEAVSMPGSGYCASGGVVGAMAGANRRIRQAPGARPIRRGPGESLTNPQHQDRRDESR